MKNRFQINHSFDWDNDLQVDDFLAHLGKVLLKTTYIDSQLAIIETTLNKSELLDASKKFGISGGYLIAELQ